METTENSTLTTSFTEVSTREQCSFLPLELEFESSSQNHSTRLSGLSRSPDWNDWHWQMKNRIRRVSQLKTTFPGIDDSGATQAAAKFPMAITPYYASLIRKLDDTDPVFLMSVPQFQELMDPPCLNDDPLEENKDMPVPWLIHRYADRALLIATTRCAAYCRHCTRKRIAGQRESCISSAHLKSAVAYLQEHPEIHDVIISGGDPLSLPTPVIEQILTAVTSVSSVQIVRIGTRTPVVLPMRITDELVAVLSHFKPLYINTHFNHPVEMTPAAADACARLVEAGIPVNNQSVLLRGVNDNPELMEELCRALIRNRVRPYYLFQCDLVRGVEHFRTPISRGIEIMEYLRGRLGGLAIPNFVVDVPHGGGKIPLTPNYILSMSPTHTVLRNYEGMLVSYPEPGTVKAPEHDLSKNESSPTVWDLSSGRHTRIQPQQTTRQARRRRASTPPSCGSRRKTRTKLSIGMVHDLRNDYLAEGFTHEQVAEFDSETTILALEQAFRDLGHEPHRIGHGRALCRKLAEGARWDLVFSIAEGVDGRSREAQVPALLEMHNIPYVFSDPLVCAVTLDKAVCKRLVREAGLNTPDHCVIRKAEDICNVNLAFPLFVKPLAEGTGKGINECSRVNDLRSLTSTCNALLKRFNEPVLVEEFLPGREFTVGILGTADKARVIGTMEVQVLPEAGGRIYSLETKEHWEECVRYSRPPDPELRTRVEDLALKAYIALECRDVGRVDIRMDARGNPSFMEINVLPGLQPHHSDLPMIAAQEGMSYVDLIGAIIESAIARSFPDRKKPSDAHYEKATC